MTEQHCPDPFIIAGVQMDIGLNETSANILKMIEFAKTAAENNARIVVFPELSLTGYMYEDQNSIPRVAEPVPGPATDAIANVCRSLNIFILMGMIETADGIFYNSVVLVGPNGVTGVARKAHLPYLGADKWVSPGNLPFEVFQTPWGRIGVLVCFDGSFPEAARVLALKKADIIFLCTNWPDDKDSARSQAYITPTRAIENHVYYCAVNRVGIEKNVKFMGKSRFVDFNGTTIVQGSPDKEEILYAKIDLQQVRNNVVCSGQYDMSRLEQRRPELYGLISER